jgi:hypothetical protein
MNDVIMGIETPRHYPPPLRELTPETTDGFALIAFAELIGVPFLPWQKWLALHALELNPDGSYRFQTVLVLIARQNGKTTFMKVLALWRMYVDMAMLVLGVAQSLMMALEVHNAALDLAQDVKELADEVVEINKSTGRQSFALTNGARYKVAAANDKAGRGLSVDLLMFDELRTQKTYDAWSALSKTVMARHKGQIFCASNAGDDNSVVLNHLRDQGLIGTEYTGMDEPESIGLFEWSAPENCSLDDPLAIAQANPSLGHTLSWRAIKSALLTDPPAVFRTEVLCQRVVSLDSPVDPAALLSCQDRNAPDLVSLNRPIVLCVDVAPNGFHATAIAAVHDPDTGKTFVDTLDAWDSTQAARDALPALIADVQPHAIGWFAPGPAAALSSDIRKFKAAVIQEIKGSAVTEACQEAVDLIIARKIVHYGDPLMVAHLTGAARLPQGDGWRFMRRGPVGYCDGAYAFAGAVYLARNVPDPVRKPRPMVV